MANEAILEVKNLKTYFSTDDGIVKAVDDVSFSLAKGETLGIVGESGCGKSVTSLSVMRLIPSPPGRIMSGDILLDGASVLAMDNRALRELRGGRISMIFQDPMTCLNPFLRISTQLVETFRLHQGLTRHEAKARAVEMLRMVGIPNAERRIDAYPHQFSGGMRQRVMIAMALSCNPEILIADEPTTALDVTIQAQILDLMMSVKQKTSDAAILLITHNLGMVAENCQRVAVMYGGKIQEIAETSPLFEDPLHPYTRGLMRSLPRPDKPKERRLPTIKGIVPSILAFPPGCKFNTRCDERIDACDKVEPDLLEVKPGRWCRCHLVKPGKTTAR